MNNININEYDHLSIEQKWQDFWHTNATFKSDTSDKTKKKMYCLDMFPYPSGSGLHLGHPLGYTATDIFARYYKMQGYSVIHPMGWDAFGLPAEQHAVKTGEHPAIITEENCGVFKKQLQALGFSYDWDREVFTCRQDYYKWTQWIFLKLYNSWFDLKLQKARPISELEIPQEIKIKGEAAVSEFQQKHRLAFYSEALVNWCPDLGTVLANEEVKDGVSEVGGFPVIRKPMKQWMLRITAYADRLLKDIEAVNWPENIKDQQRNWIGKREGAIINFNVDGSNHKISAFTTRPDTLFGVTFFVMSPEHPIVPHIVTDDYKAEVTKYCDEALKLSDFQRTLENRKKSGVFTGAHVINPINKEMIPVYVGDYVLMSYGTGAVMGVPAHDERDFEFARMFQIEIRPVIKPINASPDITTATLEGEIPWTEPGLMIDSSSPVAVELAISGKTNEVAKDLITTWLIKTRNGEKTITYRLRDWLFSRQRYWGEPIPIVHWDDGSVTALIEDELPLVLPPVKDFKPGNEGESPLSKATEWLKVVCPKTGKKGRRETNTMPQWAGSCWYYLRFIDPKNESAPWDAELEKRFMPVDLYVGGAEHAVLHLLYARFWHKVLFDLGYVSTNEPFQRLFNQGMILAHAFKNRRGVTIAVDEVEERDSKFIHKETGEELEKIVAKMSKSLRNVVTPDEITSQYGADTLRLYLMFMGPLDATRMWDSKAIAGTHRFIRRSWNFIVGDKESTSRITSENQQLDITRALHRMIKKVGEDIENLRYNTAISTMMEFLNLAAHEQVTLDTLKTYTLLLAPFAPHIAEEMWARLGESPSVANASWPTFDPALISNDIAKVVIQVNGKKRGLVEVGIDITMEDLTVAVIAAMADTQFAVTAQNRFIPVFQPGTKVPRLVNVLT